MHVVPDEHACAECADETEGIDPHVVADVDGRRIQHDRRSIKPNIPPDIAETEKDKFVVAVLSLHSTTSFVLHLCR
jgi:hypothetical protein